MNATSIGPLVFANDRLHAVIALAVVLRDLALRGREDHEVGLVAAVILQARFVVRAPDELVREHVVLGVGADLERLQKI